MKQDEKRPYHHGNVKESAIETALEMLESEGLEAITLRELSARIGASRTAIYRHFENKEALIREVILSGFERFDAFFIDIFAKAEVDVLARFTMMGRAYLAFAVNNPQLYRVLFGPTVRQEREEVCDLEDAEKATGFHALVHLIEAGQHEGVFKKGDPFLLAATVWSTVHGLASLIIDGHLVISDNIDAIFEAGNRTLLEGLKTER
ncbi:TetR/AcrR family transcriptional regulator [Thiomicrolovo sp. ZZH C-3]